MALALLASGCANEREVLVRVPISRLELPEPGPRMFEFAIAQTGEVKAVLTPDQVNTPPNPSAPELRDDRDAMARFGFSPQPHVTVALKGQSNVGGVQAKFMPLAGRGPFSVAGTVYYATGEDEYEVSGGAFTDVESTLLDFALIAGMRVSPTLLVYGGAYHSNVSYDGHHRADPPNEPATETRFAGDLTSVGANAGLAWTFGRWGRLLLEYSHASVEAGERSKSVGEAALSFEVFFGVLAEHARRAEQDREPIEVVPPAE